MNRPRVAIVGAGMGGLVCASVLRNAGIEVTMFDKGRFPGGRLASRERDTNTFDYGAQYFTVRDPRFKEFLDPFLHSGKVTRWNGQFGRLIEGVLTEQAPSSPRYVGVPLMRSLPDALAESIDCRLSHHVSNISREDGKWLVTGSIRDEQSPSSFSFGDFDFVVLNMPPAQASAIRPFPGLNDIKMRPCCALLLTFEDRTTIGFDGVELDDQVLSWVARDSSKPGRHPGERWVIHSAPDWSQENFDIDQSEIIKVMKERFATIFDIKLPPTSFVKLHNWRFALPLSPPAGGCIFDSDAAIAYCGDWYMGSRVEGAFLSGLSAAEKIVGEGTN